MTWLKFFIIPALLTGGFCAVFAVVVESMLPPAMGYTVAIAAGISGFLGSIFANAVLGQRRR